MSIYDCDEKGPYSGFIGKRVVVCVVGVVINTDFEKSWKRAVERYVEINGIGNLEKELLVTYKPQKEQLCNHILKNSA